MRPETPAPSLPSFGYAAMDGCALISCWRVRRMAGNKGSEEWPFWLRVTPGTVLRVRLAVVRLYETFLPGMSRGMDTKVSGVLCCGRQSPASLMMGKSIGTHRS